MAARLSDLQSRKARIMIRGHGETWTGQIIGLTDVPCLLLIEEGGRLVVLPQSHRVTELPVDAAAIRRAREAATRAGFRMEEVGELTRALSDIWDDQTPRKEDPHDH